VHLGDWVIMGGLSGIHQFCKVGAHVMLGVGTVALKDIPPFLMAYGNPATPYGLNLRGLKRRGFSTAAVEALKQTYRLVYRSGLTVDAALEQLTPLIANYPEVAAFCDFIRTSGRGIIR
jgi:UDP-N-acetylglucosamine acyltransferase